MALDSGLAIERFNGRVYTEYQTLRLFQPGMMIYREADLGEVVNFPVLEPMLGRNQDDGVSMADNIMAPRTPEVALDDPIKVWKHIKKTQVDVRPELELINEYSESLGRDIANAETLRLIQFLGQASAANYESTVTLFDNVVTGQLQPTQTNAPANIQNALLEIFSQMDSDGVPPQGRFGILNSPQWWQLLKAEGVIRRDWGGQANVQAPGDVIMYGDCPIFRGYGGFFGLDTTATPYAAALASKYEYAGTAMRGVFWHHDAWVMRRVRRPEVLVDWQSQTDMWKIEARSHMGTGVIKAEDGIWRLEESASTG